VAVTEKYGFKIKRCVTNGVVLNSAIRNPSTLRSRTATEDGQSAIGKDELSGVSIIIPVFNKVDLTRQFLQSFVQWLPGKIPFEIIIANNASTDGTAAFLAEFAAAHPWFSCFTLEKNGGYGRACTAGAARAKFSHLLFLNNDMLALPGWLEPLAAAFADESVGAAGGRLIYPNSTIQHAGIAFREDRLPIHPFRELHYQAEEVSAKREYPAVTGACLMVPKRLFEEVGGFDPAYAMYYEDIDLCLKIVAKKKRIVYIPECTLVHLEGKSSGSFGEANAKNLESMPVFLGKWGSFLSKALREEPELFSAGKPYGGLGGGPSFEERTLKETLATLLYCIKNDSFLHAFDHLLRNNALVNRNERNPVLATLLAELTKKYTAWFAAPREGNGEPAGTIRGARTAREAATAVAPGGRPLRVLFMNRANAFTMPGGDTIVMNRLRERLIKSGVTVDFCADPHSGEIAKYDLVHLFNLTVPAATDLFAKNAALKNVPFAVTALQEDFRQYYHKAITAFTWFRHYVTGDAAERETLGPMSAAFAAVEPIPLVSSPFAARAARLLFACGESEARTLGAAFPGARVAVIPFGSSIKAVAAPAALFEETFGVKNFVLCVGRLEIRKNQLMLLKALEEEDITVVFADGGFAYIPEYAALCRIYKRKGKTVFTGRLSDELLVSAYRACRLHCLPSWYELPGLVSLEAALYGRPVAASSWGCLPDYLGDACAWCAPDDPASVRAAVLAAYAREGDGRAAAGAAALFTWDKFATVTLDHYRKIIEEHRSYDPRFVAEAEASLSAPTLQAFLTRITQLAEQGNFAEALKVYDAQRKSFTERTPELEQVDGLLEKLRARLGKAKG
jgi:GT2 family glycosyltransferase/glycosyltransferase involved in cell wall biosynthesis